MPFLKNAGVVSEPTRHRGPVASGGGAAETSISIIGSGMGVVGELVSEGSVRVEGSVRGTIRARSIMIVRGGVVDGDVFAESAVIGGEVTGSIVASDHLELQATCSVSGEIVSPMQHLKVASGARFSGNIRMLEAGEAVTLHASGDGDAAAEPPEVEAAAEVDGRMRLAVLDTGAPNEAGDGEERNFGRRTAQRGLAGVG